MGFDEIPRFPNYSYRGKKLIWDYRQKSSSEDLFYIRKNIPLKAQENLEKKALELKAEILREEHVAFSQVLKEAEPVDFQSLKIVGVTGTNGKSSCCALLRHVVLKENKRVLEIGTMGVSFWETHSQEQAVFHQDLSWTTPDLPVLWFLLKRAELEKIDFICMELSSHAAVEERSLGIELDALIFTNLSQDHLDFHGDMQSYKNAKKLYFERLFQQKDKIKSFAVVNSDDKCGSSFAEEFRDHRVYSVKKSKDYSMKPCGVSHMLFHLTQEQSEQKIPLIGGFNAQNVALVIRTLSLLLEKSSSKLLSALKDFCGVKGRLEYLKLAREGKELHFFVDYAHTPDALEQVLKTIRALCSEQIKLWCLFGCGGDRDAKKRPLMAQSAGLHAHFSVVTSDNPRTENPYTILEDIETGFQHQNYILIEDREKALLYCIEHMSSQDVCLVAGKGHEEYQILGSKKINFSDINTLKKFEKENSLTKA